MAPGVESGEDQRYRLRAQARGEDHTVPVSSALSAAYAISSETGEAAMWGALVVAMFSLIAGAPIMSKFWLKPPPPKPPVESVGQPEPLPDPAPPVS